MKSFCHTPRHTESVTIVHLANFGPCYTRFASLLNVQSRAEKLEVYLDDCREEARLSLGLRDVMGTIYDQLGWSSLLGARRKSANRIVRELVLARLSQPESKRATVDALANQVGITFSLDSVYRSMDFLDAGGD